MTCQCAQCHDAPTQLIADIRSVTNGQSWVATSELMQLLIAHNPGQWSAENHYGKDLTAQRMGRMLASKFGIYSTRNHAPNRGYCVSVFKEAQ